MMLNRGAPLGKGQGGWSRRFAAESGGSRVGAARGLAGGEFTGGTQHHTMLNRGAPLGEGQGGGNRVGVASGGRGFVFVETGGAMMVRLGCVGRWVLGVTLVGCWVSLVVVASVRLGCYGAPLGGGRWPGAAG